MSSKRKFNRSKSKYTLSQRIISAVTAAGFVMQPIAGLASTITKVDAPNANLLNNGVANIWADKVVGNAAVNRFDKFQLDANNIANMYFATSSTATDWQNNLVNFVNSRIDINGTVNAINNAENKIGGNLFFLSKDGMAVGKTGVINTGALYVMTPTADFMTDILGDDLKGFNQDKFTAQWGDGTNGNIAKMQIPINPSGTISVLGTVNAETDVKMMAAQIGVGKNVSDDSAYNADESNQAIIRTGIDFSDFVNIGKEGLTQATFNENLTVKEDDATGDIVLSAVASTVNSTDENFDKYKGSYNQAKAEVTIDGKVQAAGDAQITAEATNGVSLEKLFDDDSVIESDDNFTEAFGQIIKNVATVNINGEVSGQHVDVQANTVNNYVSGTDEDVNLSAVTNIAGLLTANWDASYAVLANEAVVNINEGAVVKATAAKKEGENALNISADSVLKASVGSSTSAIKLANIKNTNAVPAASVAYAKTDNKAEVNIAGELHSAGHTNISANAESKLEVSAIDRTTQLGGDSTVFNLAAVIADGSNSSNVNIANTAGMTYLNGDLAITATSVNSVDTQVLVKGKNDSFIATAVNVTDYDSSADVKIDAAIEADNVDILAGNSVLKNNIVANNNIGSSYLMNFLITEAKGTKTAQSITDFVGKIKEKITGASATDNTKNALGQLGEWASVGVSVAVVNESNTANVTLTKNAAITAQSVAEQPVKGDIDIAASNIIYDTSMQVTGATGNYGDTSNTAIVNAAVLYSDMDNSAAVTLEGGDAHNADNAKYTQLNGADISVQANSEFKYGRVDKMIGDILLLCSKLEGAYASNTDYAKNVADLKAKAEEFKKNSATPGYLDSEEGNAAALALAAAAQKVSEDAANDGVANQIKDIFIGPFSVVGAAAQFANPNNYANFQAGTTTSGQSGDNAAKAAVTGAVNLNYLNNNATVLVGKNTVIDAAGKVDIDAAAAQADVAFNGKLGFTGGADNAVGGTVGVHFTDVNSLAAIAEGVEITGSAINIGAQNDVTHTAITFGAGKSQENAIAGMASYLEGDSNSIVSIDDEAKLTTTGRNEYTNTEDDDAITGISDGSVNITAHNNTVLTNIAGGAALGSVTGIGASVAITDYDVYNMAGIVDNDAGVTTTVGAAGENETEEQQRARVQKENVAKLQELTKAQSGLTDEQYAAMFGSKGTTVSNAGINAHDVNVDVLTDGTINTITVAGSMVSGSDDSKPGIGDKISNFTNNLQNRASNVISKLDTAVQNKYNGTTESPNFKPTDMQASNPNAGQALPKLTISGAGSSSVNIIDGASTAILDGAKITLNKDNKDNNGRLNVSAKDESFIGAWSGAAALSLKTFNTEQNQDNKSVGFAGTVGVNTTDTDVAAIISNSQINNAGSITNTATKSGALVAAGLGLALAKSGNNGNNYTGAASVSVNVSENDIYALMQGNTVNNNSDVKTALTNSAYDNDVQVTGGINASIALGGKQGVAVGGTVTYAEVTNNVQSAIVGGTYNNMGTVDVKAVTDITQVGAAVGVAASTGDNSNYGLEGVAAYNQLNNNADAVLDGVTMTADKVNAQAYDTNLDENKYTDYINDRGLDATGESYLQNISDTSEDLYEKDDDGSIKLDDNGQPILKVGKTGNTIVTGALGITATTGTGGGSGSAAISISDINNDFNASIKNSNIKANGLSSDTTDVADVNLLAKSDTLLVGIAAGGAGANKGFAGAGSFAWNTINNDNTASIEKSTIDAASTKVNAVSGTLGVNVAGQISVGKNAVGLAVAYNDLENNTGAYILGSDIKNTSDDNKDAEETDVTVTAQNSGKMYAIGAGVSMAVSADSQFVANGTVGVNRGNNNLEAIIGDYVSGSDTKRTKITNAKNINVTSNDNSSSLSIAGGVGISKGVAVGGSIAYNEIGNISGNADGKKQQNTAQINNADITTADKAQINVKALDTASLTTAGVGVGIAAGGNGAGVAVQGAAATALINKDTEASMTGVDVSKYVVDNTGADVDVTAQSNNTILTTADTLSVAAGSAAVAVGAGVAVNRSEADVKALVNGGMLNVENAAVQAFNTGAITTIGIGGSVAGGTGAGVTGSVAVNQLGNNTTAKIADGAVIMADNNVIVNAQSDEQIANYAGSASVAAQGAAVGLSVSVNQIDGDTTATIEGDTTSVTAAGKGEDATVKDTVEDNAILDNFVDEKAFDSQASLADKRTDSNYKGVAVSASSTHTIKSFLANVGVAGQGAAVNGTVNVNQTDGSTTAAIKGADINKDAVLLSTNPDDVWQGDVNVVAHDYSNSAGIVGSASIAGTGAGVSLGSDTNTLSREVTAEVTGKASDKNTINADAFNVEADAKQGISSLTVGVGVAGVGGGVANATSVALLDGVTTAKVNNVKLTASEVDVTADHTGKITTLGTVVGAAGVGAGVGVAVSVLDEDSQTKTEVRSTDITITDDSKNVDITANNTTKVNYQLYGIGGGAVGVAGSIGVANVNSTVDTLVDSTNIGSTDAHILQTELENIGTVDVTVSQDKARNINIGAKNTIDFVNKSGSGAAGAVGVGVGVAVNTIDSHVNTNVTNSNLYAANDINVTAAENRNVDQLAVNAQAGAVAGGANVMVTNVGGAVAEAYGENLATDGEGKVTDGGSVNIKAMYDEANGAVNGNKLNDGYTMGAVDENNAAPNVTAKTGGEGSIVKVTVDKAQLNAGNKAALDATEETNVKMDGIQASAGLVGSVSGAVGILNVHRNSGVEVKGTTINARDLAISTAQKGTSSLDIYQGSLGGLATIGAAYGSASSSGVNGIGIGSSTFNITDGIDITASDASKTEVNAIGVALAAGGAASVIVAQGSNEGSTTIKVESTKMDAGDDIDINAERRAEGDSLSVSAIAASGGLVFAGAGVGATASEKGTVGVELTTGNKLTSNGDVNLTALNAPSVSAKTGAVAGSVYASAAATVAKANIGTEAEHLKTYVKVGQNNTFAADNFNAQAVANAAQNVNMEGLSVAAYGGTVQVNAGGAETYSDVDVRVEDKNTFKDKYGETDVLISGDNSVTQNVSAKGISVGTWFASGTNDATSTTVLKTNVTASSSADESRIDDLKVKGGSSANVNLTAEGDGGGLVDISPDAAAVTNNYTADTNVTLGGAWDVGGAVDVQALNGGAVKLNADAVRAAVVGGSGVWLDNDITNTANVNITDANITAEGKQSYTAKNTANYDGDIAGSGYGGLTINGTQMRDNFVYDAAVNISGSTLKGTGEKGSITAQALTDGTIDSYNSLKSAGVIPVSIADSAHVISYDNKVNVSGNSSLTTAKKQQDITLAASDNTVVNLQAIADTQGGVAGAASTDLSNTMTRNNTVTVGANTFIESSNDVNLYAGADGTGKYASLDIDIVGDAYNKTVIPLCTKPEINNAMSQANVVNAGGDVGSVRNINAKAVKGETIIIQSAKEYNLYTGESGSGSIAMTADGTISGSSESHANAINVTGDYKAGIHNTLTINISGSTNTVEETADKEAYVDYSGIKVEIAEGADWFNPKNADPKTLLNLQTLELTNTLLERYKAVESVLAEYAAGTTEYNNLQAELNKILEQMKELNFVDMKYNEATRQWEKTDKPADKITVQGVALPDIVVSGGSINLEGDSLTGTENAKLTAKGAPQVTINNSSDLYLEVHDISIAGAGGDVTLNGSELGASGFIGTVSSDTTNGVDPNITIASTSGPASAFPNNPLVQADIGIVGNLSNAEGIIDISNKSYNIVVSDKATLSAQNISLRAESGSVSQTSTTGIFNVAGDPIAQYQFGEAVAKKVQEYLHLQLQNNSDYKVEFESYDDYLRWLVKTVGINPSELNLVIKNSSDIIINDDEVQNAVEKYLLKQALAKDGRTYNVLLEQFGFYKSYKPESWEVDAEINKYKNSGDAMTWYNYLISIGLKPQIRDSAITKDLVVDEKAGILAGTNVYINALNVNINGLVQAGYGNYSTELTDAANTRIAEIISSWNNGPLTDSEVMGNSAYLVNEGGAKWNSDDKIWDYEVSVYYNPYTKKLLVDSVTPSGGQVYINGAVSSTGSGRIMAMDGMADIAIDTTAVTANTVEGVVVNEIANRDIEGLVSITDTNKTKNSKGQEVNGLVTEYKNGQWREYEYQTKTEKLPAFTDLTASSDGTYTYNPEEGLRYEYTGGYDGGQTNRYTYKDYFMFWGWVDYSTSDQLKNAMNNEGDAEVTISSNNEAGDSLASGVYIGKGNTGGNNDKDWYITGSYNAGQEVQVGGIVSNKQWGWHKGDSTKDPDWVGKMFGYGRITYNWVTRNSTASATTSSIKADNSITIGFIGSDNKGNINITGGQNIELAGNISNAAINGAGAGNVSITSNSGSISSSNNANIISDNVILNAANGIDVTHLAIGNSANINAVTDSGDIDFTSYRGNLNIQQMVTGGDNPINASTGSVSLQAQGNILDAASGSYAIKGQRIDLVSTDGGIGTLDSNGNVTNALRLLAGSDMYSSDAMASSVNAQAKGDIALTQVSGDMRLGQIISTDGDVVLTVDSGNFVDAYNPDSLGYSDTADKLQRWIDAGLIDANADDSSSEAAGQQAKKDRLDALEIQMSSLAEGKEDKVKSYKDAAAAFAENKDMQAAKEEYQNKAANTNSTVDEINAAYTTYQNAVAEYFKDSGFTAEEQAVIANYAELSASTNYGWSKNELLYAIQSSVINSKPTQTVSPNTYANVQGNNITLNAANGGIGVDSAAKSYSYSQLSDIETLKTLAAAKAGDLTWIDKDETVVIKQQKAINVAVNSTDGEVHAVGKDNVYLAGVQGSPLNITSIDTDGDIKLMANSGVYMVGQDGLLSGNNLIITGGQGGVGTSDNHVHTQISGTLDTSANDAIYIDQVGDLVIQAAASDADILLSATGNMLMTQEDGKDSGYLNAHGVIDLTAGGNIGTAEHGLRILNNGSVVNASAQNGDIYLDAKQNGTLVLGTVTGESLNIVSAGSVNLGRAEDTEEDEEVIGKIETKGNASIDAAGSINLVNGTANIGGAAALKAANDITLGSTAFASTGNASFTAGDDIELQGGSVTVNSGAGTLGLTATAGSITQNSANHIEADTVNASATGNILLGSKGNVVNSFNVLGLGEKNSVTGSVEITSSSAGGMNVDLKGITVIDGHVSVTNLVETLLNITGGGVKTQVTSEDDTVNGDITFSSAGAISNDSNVTSAKDIVMNAAHAVVENGNAVYNEGSLIAQDDVLVNTTSGAIDIGGKIKATTGEVKVTTNAGDITTNGTIYAGTNVTVDAVQSGKINISGAVNAETGSASITTGLGDITTTNAGSITAGQSVTVNAEQSGNINISGLVDAEAGNATITTGLGNIDIAGSVTATSGNVTVDTDEGAVTIGRANSDDKVTSGQGTYITAGKENGTAKDNDITVNGAVEAGTEIIAKTYNGNITVVGTTTASDGDVQANVNGNGNISFADIVSATQNVIAKVTGSGDITTTGTGTITAGSGNAELTTNAGNITTAGAIYAGYNVKDGTAKSDSSVVTITTGAGNIKTEGAIGAGKDVTATTNAGDIEIGGKVNSVTGSTHLTAHDNAVETDNLGNVTVKGEIASGEEVIVNAYDGNITVEGKTTANGGDVQAIVTGIGDILLNGLVEASRDVIAHVTSEGDITTTNNITGGVNVDITTNHGVITIGTAGGNGAAGTGTVTATTGYTHIIAGNEDKPQDDNAITVNSTVGSKSETIIKAYNGPITIKGAVTAKDEAVEITTGAGDINIVGSVTSGGSTSISAGTAPTQEDGNDAKQGSVTVKGEIDSGEDVTIDAVNGDIEVDGEINASSTEPGKGNVSATVTGDGSITVDGKVNASNDVEASVTGTGTISVNGSINAGYNSETEKVTPGTGDVFLTTGAGAVTENGDPAISTTGSVTAGKDVTVDAGTNGDIELGGSVTATGGDVKVDTDEGKITIGAVEIDPETGETTTTGSVTSGGNTYISAGTAAVEEGDEAKQGSVTVKGEINSGEEVDIDAVNGSITVEGTTTAKDGDVTATVTGDGSILLDGEINASSTEDEGNVTATVTGDGSIAVGGEVNASNDVEASVTGTGTISVNGSINAGYNSETEKVTPGTGDVSLTTGAGAETENGDPAISTTGSVTAGTNVMVDAGTSGDISLGGSVTAESGNASITTGTGDITTTSDVSAGTNVTVDAGTSGNIELGGDVTADKGSVTVDTDDGDISTSGAISAGTSVGVNTDEGKITIGTVVTDPETGETITTGSVTSGGSTSISAGTAPTQEDGTDAKQGSVTVNGSVDAGTDVTVNTYDGDIKTTGSVTGGNDVTVNADKQGKIELGGDVTAESGNVQVTTDSGAITTTGDITAGYNTETGQATNETSEITITTGKGDINTTGSIGAGKDVTIDTAAGDVKVGGSVNSVLGDTTINAGTKTEAGITTDEKGNVTVDGNVASGKEVIVNAIDGNITVTGTTTTTDGNVQATVTGDGSILFDGAVNANGNAVATVTGEGDIGTGAGDVINANNINFTTNEGAITIGSDLNARENINLSTDNDSAENVANGNISIGGNLTAGSENAGESGGNITITINHGNLTDVKDNENVGKEITANAAEGNENSGNITIKLTGKGDVDLYDLYATNDARLDIANGNLTLHEINGELVAMQLRTEGKKMNVGEIIAGTQIILSGSDLTLDQISQRPDSDNMLIITPDGSADDKPINNLTIGNITTSADSGLRFERLWVNNSNIHISQGQLWFDKLYVENVAHFSNNDMVAAIYGVPPLRDGSDSEYWMNTDKNRPEQNLAAWRGEAAGLSDWMYLRFVADHIQESNGILLLLDEYDYVYNQRFTAEDHLRWQHSRYLDKLFKQTYGYEISHHDRYPLADYQLFEDNADEDEISVEA